MTMDTMDITEHYPLSLYPSIGTELYRDIQIFYLAVRQRRFTH